MQAASPNLQIDPCSYTSDAAASVAWQPGGGTARAGLGSINGQPALRLRCNFAAGHLERAYWDRAVRLDLSGCRGVQLQVFCQDASPVAYFSLYFQSGEGWYHTVFFPESTAGWTTIAVDRAEMKAEGEPAGWDQIKTIRISAWRAREGDTEFYVRDLRRTGLLGADIVVAVVRGTTGAGSAPGTGRSRAQGPELLAQQFEEAGVACSLLESARLSAESLKAVQLVVLPPGLVLTDVDAVVLACYLQQGGKVLALSPLPVSVRAVAGPTNCLALARAEWPNEPERQRELLLAKAAALAPEPLRQAAQASIERIGRVASFASFAEATNRITALITAQAAGRSVPERREGVNNPKGTGLVGHPGGPEQTARPGPSPEVLRHTPVAGVAAQTLAAAVAAREKALGAAAQQQFPEALKQAKEARRLCERAFCAAQQPEPGEFRGFWCHSALGVQGLSWEEAIRRLATNGFTAIFPNMLWGGAAFYDSKVLPVAAPVAEHGDQLQQCIAACRKHGLQVHVWKVDWNLGSTAPKEFVEQMRRAGRLQVSSSGEEEPWLCPSHPANQQLEVAAMLEVVRNYDVDGIHFDYIRYPGVDHCFCAGCQERFQRACGGRLQHWPADVLAGGPLRQHWLEWRRSNITTVVKAVSEQARAIKPAIKLSAAVFRQWNTDRDGVGQDWKLWCDQRWLDFVCPMDYTPSNTRFENMVTAQVAWAGSVPCYPGLGVSASSSRFGADRAIEQINITRKQHTHGFVIFNYGVKESEELLPLLGLGVTREP